MENPIPAGLASKMGLLVTGVMLYLPLSPQVRSAVPNDLMSGSQTLEHDKIAGFAVSPRARD